PSLIICSFFFRTLRHPSSTLFPYTTLFRSSRGPGAGRESISWAGSRRPSRDGHRALENRVTYAKAFFDLQLQFAHKVTRLSGLPLARALLEYTNLYARFGLGRDFDPAHPTWQ